MVTPQGDNHEKADMLLCCGPSMPVNVEPEKSNTLCPVSFLLPPSSLKLARQRVIDSIHMRPEIAQDFMRNGILPLRQIVGGYFLRLRFAQ